MAFFLPAFAQDLTDEAHFRREIDRDPARAVEELNPLLREKRDPLLLLLRAIALARLGEKRDALEDARGVLAEPREERLEDEAAKLVKSLRGLEVALRAPAGVLLPRATSVALIGSARGALDVDWAVYRFDERRVRDELARRASLDELLRRPPSAALARVDAGHDTIDAKGAFEKTIELGATRAPGIYMVAATVGDVPLRATVQVARHGLAARVTASETLLWAFDRTTGEPREGVAIDALDGERREVGVTDKAGLLRAGLGEIPRGALLGWSEGAFARLDLATVAAPASAAAPLDIIVERPLVRPGESVRAIAVSPVVSSTHVVRLRDASGEAIAWREVATDAQGVAAIDFAIPRVAREGAWTLEAAGGAARFEVAARPAPPPFSVALPDVPPLVVAGEPFLAHVRASGLAGAHATWRVHARGHVEPILAGAGPLDEDGELKIAARSVPAGELVLEATVDETGGRSVTEGVPLHVVPSRLAWTLDAEPPRAVRVREGVDLRLTFFALDGSRARSVSVVASATLAGREVLHVEQALESNVVSLHVPLEAAGVAKVSVRAKNPLGEAVLEREVLVVGDELPVERPLVLDRDEHRAGESVRLFARLPRESGFALVTKERGGVRARSVERFEHGTLETEAPLDAGDVPGVELVVACVTSGVLHAASAAVRVTAAKPLAIETLIARTDPLDVVVRSREPASVRAWATDARPFDLLAETVAAHGFSWPARSELVATVPCAPSPTLPRFAGEGAAPPPAKRGEVGRGAREDDLALVAHARALDLAASVADVGTTDAAGVATFELPLAGPLHVGVVAAASGRSAHGEARAAIDVPLEVRADVPPVLTEGDEGELVATVIAASDAPQDVKLTWTARGFLLRGPPRLAGAKPASGHEPEADALWVALPARGRAELRFTAKAPAPGLAQLEVEALGEKLRAQATGDARVLGRSVPRSRTESGALGAAPLALDPTIADAAHPELVTGEVVIAPTPAAAARDALEALAAAEARDAATLAARLVPDVAALSSAAGAPIEPPAAGDVLSLLELQRPDGSWPSSATACALEAIAAAPSSGLVLEPALARGIAAARRELATSGLQERPALALALTLAGAAPRDEIARLASSSALDALGRFTLARALVVLGERDRARALLAVKKATTTEELAEELIVRAQLDEDPARRVALAGLLLARRDGVQWATPRLTALAARALLELEARMKVAPPTHLEVLLDDGKRPRLLKSAARSERSLRVPLDGKLLASARGLTVAQKGGVLVPYVLDLRWTKLTQGLRPLERGVSVKRTVARVALREDGTPGLEPITSRGVPLGSELRVTVTVESHTREALALEEPLPAGARFLGETGASGVELTTRPGALVVLFAPQGSVLRTFSYSLRAERVGDWRALPSRAHVPAQPEFAGETDEWLLRVRD